MAIFHIIGIDQGAPITIVSGVHGGCYELFAHGGIRTISDLRGKTVSETGDGSLISMMAAWVGLNPKKDLKIVTDPDFMGLFAQGKHDAHLAFPP